MRRNNAAPRRRRRRHGSCCGRAAARLLSQGFSELDRHVPEAAEADNAEAEARGHEFVLLKERESEKGEEREEEARFVQAGGEAADRVAGGQNARGLPRRKHAFDDRTLPLFIIQTTRIIMRVSLHPRAFSHAFIGVHTVIPAHSSGATPSKGRFVGTRRQNWRSTTIRVL